MLIAQDLDSIQANGLPGFKFGQRTINGVQPGRIIAAVLPYVFGAAGLLLLIYLVTAGLSMMMSRGDPKAMQAAQARITNALIGFVIVFFAFAIVALIGKILNIPVFGSLF
jgi:hypothetical protein